MSRQRIRVLTLVLLGLLIAAPLSFGDKGLWLSFASTPQQVLDVVAGGLAPEQMLLLHERTGRMIVAPRLERSDAVRSLDDGGIWIPARSGSGWVIADSVQPPALGELYAGRPAPRAPPA
jgi:hypothetical protein